MTRIIFKDVGQGDSILIEWEKDSKIHFGIVDCRNYQDRNPIIEEIVNNKISQLDFIILSHLHHDHYSGLGELLGYCIENKIVIKKFLHTFTNDFLRILDLEFVISKRKEYDTELLMKNIEAGLKKKIIQHINDLSIDTSPLILSDNVTLKFLAPYGDDYFWVSKQRSLYENGKSTTFPDMNRMSTIIEIKSGENVALLTSDATKKAFRRIIGSVAPNVTLAQAPHHGSIQNLLNVFWETLIVSKNCNALFSVGDVKKDKLPNLDVVKYFHNNGYLVSATNFVYGLREFYAAATIPPPRTTISALNPFSKVKLSTTASIWGRFQGDKYYALT